MKKFLLLAAVAATTLSAGAQTKALSYSKFWDNWSVGVKGGASTALTHNAILKNARPTFGAEITKQFSPAFSLGVEGIAYVNPVGGEKLAIDATNVSLIGAFNLSNIFCGYNGTPRAFELEAFGGAGWLHTFQPGNDDYNVMTSKFGLNFLFNLGESKAWGIKVSPALLYAIDVNAAQSENSFNANAANLEATVGLVYRFKGSNGAHHFTSVRAYDQAEVDGLNASINDLRGQVNAKNGELNAAQTQIRQLQNELNECRNKKPVVKTVTKDTKSLESVVTFRQGKSVIDASQLPNVERIATYLNKNRDSKVVIKGYASPEGNADLNAQLATARAEAVKTVLVKRYKISADRISAQGNGIGDMFSEADWNRVAISTIVEK